ncbi:MAG: O-antigen ligase family protein [Planctomycetota bacterium]|nr:O-antigen ligase family protein [Planctomycetota bacterium]
MVLIRSRIGFACAAVVLALTLLASLPRPFRLAVGAALIIGTVAAGGAAISSFAPELKSWLSSPPVSLRYLPWTFAWRIFAANPWLGAGAGAYPGEASALRDGPSYLGLATEDLPWRPESLPLEVAAELGGIGLLLLLIGTAAPWVALYPALDRRCVGAPRGLLLGLWAGYGGLWLNSLVAGGTDRYAENAMLFPSLGLLLAAGRLFRADLGTAGTVAAPRVAPREADRGRWAWPAAGAAVTAAIWAATVLPGIRAELTIGEAARMLRDSGHPAAASEGTTEGDAARTGCETAGELALLTLLRPAAQPRTAAAAARLRVKALRMAGRLDDAGREATWWSERYESWLWMLKRRGELALERGRPAEALSAFIRAARANPFDMAVQKGMMAALAEGTLACAAARIEEALAGAGRSEVEEGDRSYLEAMALLVRNSPEQARRVLAARRPEDVSIGSVWLLRARCLLAMGAGKATEAFQEIQVHKSSYPLDPEAYWMQADAIEAMGRFEHQDTVVDSLRRYIELRPGRPAAIIRLADIEVQRGNAAAAVPLLEDAVSRGLRDRRLYSRLSAIYRSGVFPERLEALIRMAECAFPDDEPFLDSLRGDNDGGGQARSPDPSISPPPARP